MGVDNRTLIRVIHQASWNKILPIATIKKITNKASYSEFSSVFAKCFDVCPGNRFRVSANSF